MNPQIAAAQGLIASLKSGGMSYAEIGRRVGRDVSYISQAAKGKKGGNLVGALQQLSQGAKAAPVSRRVSKSGSQARVRRGVQTDSAGNISVKTRTGDKTLVKALKKGGQKPVKWKIKVKKAKTTSDRTVKDTGFNGGSPQGSRAGFHRNTWTCDKLLDRIQKPQPGDTWQPGEARKAMAEIAARENSNSLTSYAGIQEVQMYTV